MKKAIIIASGIFLLFFATAGFLSYREVKRQEAQRQHTGKDQKNVRQSTIKSLGKFVKSDFGFWVNNSGPYTQGYKVRKGEEVKIRLSGYNEHLEKAVLGGIFAADLLEIRVEGANSRKKLKIHYDPDAVVKDLTASYTASNEGTDKIIAKIEGTGIVFETEVVVMDPSFFAVPIDLSAEDVSFDQTGDLIVDSSEVVLAGGKSFEHFGFSGRDEDLPGYVAFEFKSAGEKFEEAYLRIYAIADGALEKYQPDEPLNEFRYLENLSELNENIANKPEIPKDFKLQKYPPVNASAGKTDNIRFVDFGNGTGLRYTVAGYYQAYDPSEHPLYFFQGLTTDGKYYVLFRYSRLYSPRLEAYLQKPFSVEPDEYKKYVAGSFEELGKERNLSPTLQELDDFVESIRIKK